MNPYRKLWETANADNFDDWRGVAAVLMLVGLCVATVMAIVGAVTWQPWVGVPVAAVVLVRSYRSVTRGTK